MRSKKLLFLLLISFLLLITFGCKTTNSNELVADGIQIEKVSIHTDDQAEYLSGNYGLALAYANGKQEKSYPKPVHLEWKDEGNNEYTLYLSENSDLSNPMIYKVNANKIDLYNLKLHTTYYYKVDNSEIKGFTLTDEIIRNMYIDGLTNVRDLGGKKIGDGVYTKQNMIIRCSKLTQDETGEVLISQKGIKDLSNVLKVKTELDLRSTDDNENGGITSSPLGQDVNYISFPMESGGNVILLNKDVLKDLFVIFGNNDNYPIIMHCSIGTDRTGAVAFMLNALLGVSDDDLYYDYLFSNFGLINGTRTKGIIDTYLKTINDSEGTSTQEKMYNYLISIGVEKQDLDNFINICK